MGRPVTGEKGDSSGWSRGTAALTSLSVMSESHGDSPCSFSSYFLLDKKKILGISLHSNKLTFWLTYKSSVILSHEAWTSLLGVWGVPLSITFCLLEHSLDLAAGRSFRHNKAIQ